MFAYVADEVEKSVIFHPVIIVDQFGRIGSIGIKIQEACQL